MHKESPAPINPHLEAFNKVVYTVSEHIFVTDETRKRREHLRAEFVGEKAAIKEYGLGESAIFLLGSVGAGMSVAESDIDIILAFHSDKIYSDEIDDSVEDIGTAYPTEMEPYNLADELVWSNDQVREVLEEGNFSFLFNKAVFFFPSLNETVDLDEKELVNGWRKALLQSLVDQQPDNAEVLWDNLCREIDRNVVHYELSDRYYEYGEVTPLSGKRAKRVPEIIKGKIAERFPDDEERQMRAYSFIEGKRTQFRYPSFVEMCAAFDIQFKGTQ